MSEIENNKNIQNLLHYRYGLNIKIITWDNQIFNLQRHTIPYTLQYFMNEIALYTRALLTKKFRILSYFNHGF